MVYSSENYVVNETICYFPGMNYDYTNVRTPSNYWVLFSKFIAVILIQVILLYYKEINDG